jgi:hypothetical protein
MFKKRLAVLAISYFFAFSAFAVTTESGGLAEPHYEAQQGSIDLVVQSVNDNSFELIAAHSGLSVSADYGKEMKLQRTSEAVFVMAFEREPLTIVNEVGWRRSYSL